LTKSDLIKGKQAHLGLGVKIVIRSIYWRPAQSIVFGDNVYQRLDILGEKKAK
jgi:hypothetical protein